MKNVFVLSFVFGLCITLGSANAQINSPKKILIVYLSRTNNTKTVAEIIQKYVGGKLVGIELETPYPADYKATVAQVVKENEGNILPPLKTRIDSMPYYDVIFVGFPTWDMKMPPPVKSFLRQYKLEGKIVIPFNTNAGYGVGSGFQTVKELCPGSTVLEGFEVKAGAEKNGEYLVIKGRKAEEVQAQINEWLVRIKLTELPH